jgi:hypothetical protein
MVLALQLLLEDLLRPGWVWALLFLVFLGYRWGSC